MKLFMCLGYQARSTNQPGRLNQTGVAQFSQGLDPLFGDDAPPVQLLVEAGVLLPASDEGEFDCPLFAKHNPHLAGNYKPGHIRGNIRSRLSAARNQIGQTAMAQTMLLAPELFQRRDGSVMPQRTVERCCVLIITLDRCLKAPQRHQGTYTTGLIADAAAVVDLELSKEDLERFFYWVAENREHPAMPKTAEEVLQKFETLYPLSRKGDL